MSAAGALAGKVAAVTGAASGIGRGVARRFVADGASVLGIDRSAGGLAQLEDELGDSFAAATADVRDPGALAAAVAAGLARWGRLDVLVANAGVYDGNVYLADIPAERLDAAWHALYEVNVLGQLHAIRAATDALRASRGSIVMTSSHCATNPGIGGGGVLYMSSKAAINGLVRQLAHELAPEVRVNGVAPGGTITDLRVVDELADLAGRSVTFEDAEGITARIEAATPLRLVATPDDHAVLYSLLASDAARALTGVVIESDGGTAVRGG